MDRGVRMDEVTGKAIRKSLHIPEEELLTIWRFPGYRDCPLGDPEMGVTNCPQGFDHAGVPTELQLWMRGVCEDESWRDIWEQILLYCRQCQENLRLSSQEAQKWSSVYEILAGGEK